MRLALVVCKADYTVSLDYANKAVVSLKGGSFIKAEGHVIWIRIRRKTDECSGHLEKEPRLDSIRSMHARFAQYLQIGEAIFMNWFVCCA